MGLKVDRERQSLSMMVSMLCLIVSSTNKSERNMIQNTDDAGTTSDSEIERRRENIKKNSLGMKEEKRD